MKTLYIIRHAKSSWANIDQTDFDRPLNERGKKDAPNMAKHLFDKNVNIDTLVTSTAVRAKNTCKIFATQFKITETNIILKPELYLAPVEVFYNVLMTLQNDVNNVAIFAHNPGITEFINDVQCGATLDNLPTTGVFALQIKTEQWQFFKEAKKEYLFFVAPKLI